MNLFGSFSGEAASTRIPRCANKELVANGHFERDSMKATVKSMWVDSAAIDLGQYVPEDPEFFGMWIEFKAGSVGTDRADDFRLLVCSPEWLKRQSREKGALWGRHMLILDHYDFGLIKTEITRKVEECGGETWTALSGEIARFAAWEFEDYGEAKS